jgi:hypothetical protein
LAFFIFLIHVLEHIANSSDECHGLLSAAVSMPEQGMATLVAHLPGLYRQGKLSIFVAPQAGNVGRMIQTGRRGSRYPSVIH